AALALPLARERQCDQAVRAPDAAAALALREYSARAPLGQREPSLILEGVQQAVHRKCVGESGDGGIERRRLREALAADLARRRRQRPQRTGRAEPRQRSETGGTEQLRAGRCRAELAALRQREAGGVERAAPNAVERTGQRI